MANFAIAFSASQADDGTVTYTDTSNWSDNTEGYDKEDFVRQIVLRDAYGVLLDTLVFATDSLVVTYALLTNKWIEAQFTVTGVADYGPLIHKDPFERIYEVAYILATIAGCGCGCGKKKPDLCEVDGFWESAFLSIPTGDGVNYQNSIDSAYKLLTA